MQPMPNQNRSVGLTHHVSKENIRLAELAQLQASKDWLKLVASDIVADHPGDCFKQEAAFFDAIKNDRALLWALLDDFRAQAARKYLCAVARPKAGVVEPVPAALRTGVGKPVQSAEARRGAQLQAMAATSAVVRKSVLRTFSINGRPIGDVPVTEARQWHEAHGAGVKFVGLLLAGLPDKGKIGDYHSDESAAVLYRQAGLETAE